MFGCNFKCFIITRTVPLSCYELNINLRAELSDLIFEVLIKCQMCNLNNINVVDDPTSLIVNGLLSIL